MRPATPRLSAGPVADELTISPTTFHANPAASLPPPPADVQRQKKGVPVYVAHDVAPRILNGAEVAELLKQNYPRTLREAGVQGTVVLWVHVGGRANALPYEPYEQARKASRWLASDTDCSCRKTLATSAGT